MDGLSKSEKTRGKILFHARKLFMARGFHNTSISDVIAATGVKKGNLYYYFPSKEELGLSVLEDARNEFFALLSKAFEGGSPSEKLNNFFAAMLKQQCDANFVGGCLFGNAALEMSDSNPRFARVLKEVFSNWTGRLEVILAQGQQAGELSKALSPALMAKLIVSTLEGAIMMARLSKDAADLEDCFQGLRKAIEG